MLIGVVIFGSIALKSFAIFDRKFFENAICLFTIDRCFVWFHLKSWFWDSKPCWNCNRIDRRRSKFETNNFLLIFTRFLCFVFAHKTMKETNEIMSHLWQQFRMQISSNTMSFQRKIMRTVSIDIRTLQNFKSTITLWWSMHAHTHSCTQIEANVKCSFN